MTAPPLRPGGSGGAVAVRIGGRVVTYRELAERIDATAADRPPAGAGADRDLTGQPVVDTLVGVFAAAATGRSVRIADPAALPAPGDPPDRPTGTAPPHWLTVVTSGSSGRPRPVRRTATSWTSSFTPLTRLIGATADDRVLLTGPLHATLHLFAAVHTLALGAELTDEPERATLVHAVPPVLADLLGDPRVTRLRTAVIAGAALPPSLAAAAGGRGLDVVEYYGAAELSFVAARRHGRSGSTSGGLDPFPGVEIDVRDGEIRVRSPYLSLGYPPGVTGPYRIDADGYATVGDRGVLDAAGRLHVHGRGTSAITVGGATVLAEDVEATLGPLVAALTAGWAGRPAPIPVAVVGAPAGRLAEVVVAVLPAAPPVDGRALRAAARSVLSGASLPRRWLVADHLPRTPGGKLARGVLQEAVRRQLCGAPAAPGAPRLRPLR